VQLLPSQGWLDDLQLVNRRSMEEGISLPDFASSFNLRADREFSFLASFSAEPTSPLCCLYLYASSTLQELTLL